MAKKRIYQADPVQKLALPALLPLLAAGCIVALDVAKTKFVVALSTLAGEVVKLFRFNHPDETVAFVEVIETIRGEIGPAQMHVAMEPTGTYGDAIRQELAKRGFAVSMVSPQRTHDSQAVFDGVRSLHDPKSAALVAKVFSMGLATPWTPPAATQTKLRALVDRRHHEHTQQEACFGRLEAALVRYWPELQRWMDVHQQKSALSLLVEFTSPAAVSKTPEQAAQHLREASHGRLSKDVIDGVVSSAASTLGLEMVDEEVEYVRTLARGALDAVNKIAQLDKRLEELTTEDGAFVKLRAWMGPYTAAVLTTMCPPLQYKHAQQLEKACGLNLREKSSGEYKGRLSITKRGPGAVRQVLYLFALRMIQSSRVVRAWYVRRRGYTEESKQRAVVAVMRKLVRAAFHVARGAEFDATKLFDVRRLDLREATPSPTPAPTPRTTKRALSRSSKRRQTAVAAPSST